MRRLIVARHGNTFERGQVPTRVGARTDPPLVAAGRGQAERIADYLQIYGLTPGRILSAPLARTRETAAIVAERLELPPPLDDARLTEIDYGPDENLPEADVEERLGRLRLAQPGADAEAARAAGRETLREWNERAAVPPGWIVDPAALERMWRALAAEVEAGPHETVLVVTSNGVARFSPAILPGGPGELPAGTGPNRLKISPGALCLFEREKDRWWCSGWCIRP